MSTTSVSNQVNKPVYDQFVFERRVLLGCTALLGVAVLVWVAAIAGDHWAYVHGGAGIYVPATRRYFLESNTGLWRICRNVLVPTPTTNTTTTTTTSSSSSSSSSSSKNATGGPTGVPHRFCKYHEMFPSEEKIRADPSLDKGILNYSRTEASFAVISMCMMCMGFFFSIYTFRNPRYTFKRLAAAIHFITASTVLVVVEVFISSLEYERAHLLFNFPAGATYSYGHSIYLAWIVFVIHLFSGLAFLLYSKKRKGSKAPTDEMGMVDEPTIIGR